MLYLSLLSNPCFFNLVTMKLVQYPEILDRALSHSELRMPGIVTWKKKGIVTKEQAIVNLSFFIFLRMINVNQYRKLLCGGCFCFICVLEAIGLSLFYFGKSLGSMFPYQYTLLFVR